MLSRPAPTRLQKVSSTYFKVRPEAMEVDGCDCLGEYGYFELVEKTEWSFLLPKSVFTNCGLLSAGPPSYQRILSQNSIDLATSTADIELDLESG